MFPEHSQIEYLGKVLGSSQLHLPEAKKAVQIIRSGKFGTADRAKLKNALSNRQKEADASGRVMVLSNEGMTAISEDRRAKAARRVKNLFGKCKIILVIRRPVDLAQSLYVQKMVQPPGLMEEGAKPRPFKWHDIDDWLETLRRKRGLGALSNLQYASTVQHLEAVLGRESIGIFLFEQLKEDPENYYRSILRFMGIDENEGLKLVIGKRENTRITQRQFDNLRRQYHEPKTGETLKSGSLKARRQILKQATERDPDDDTRKACVSMSPENAKLLDDEARHGNRWLALNFGLPLEEYGYSL